MNLMRIKYFVEVAKWGSFSKAAQMLYVSQPNLSRQIALMEQEVGFELFHRTGKTIQLTRAGEYLFGQFRDLPELAERAIAHAEAISRREECSISIGVLEGQDVNAFLSGRIGGLREQEPNLLVELERNSFRNLRHSVEIHFQYRGFAHLLLSFGLLVDTFGFSVPKPNSVRLPLAQKL